MNVAVVFFGISRDIGATGHSIQAKVLQPLRERGAAFTTVVALNLVDVIHSPRAGELNVPARKDDIFTLKADHYILSTQSAIDISAPLAAAQRQADPFGNDYISVSNLLYQLASLKRGWRVLEAIEPQGFDCYYFIRPDLLYEDRFEFATLRARLTSPRSILLPAWHDWGGLNDRFAVAGREAARHYALRLDRVEDFCRDNPLHSETFLAWTLARSGCRVGDLPVKARRVRANNLIVDEDFDESRAPLPDHPRTLLFPPIAFAGEEAEPSLRVRAE